MHSESTDYQTISSCSKTEEEEREQRPKRTVDQWLGQVLRVELVDGRVIYGRFMCTDNVPNIILHDSREFWKHKEQEAGGLIKDKVPIRNVGMVLIKGEHIQRIFHIVSSESQNENAAQIESNLNDLLKDDNDKSMDE